MATTAAKLVADARQKVEGLTADQTADELASGKPTIIDVREESERKTLGAIPGAVHVPRGMIEFNADPTSPYYMPELSPDRRTILYCGAGSRSALAATALQSLGYSSVAHLEGGFKSWQEAGKPIDRV